MGDGIGGPVVRCISGNAFELDVTHYRKDNQEQYSRIENKEFCDIFNQVYNDYQNQIIILENFMLLSRELPCWIDRQGLLVEDKLKHMPYNKCNHVHV